MKKKMGTIVPFFVLIVLFFSSTTWSSSSSLGLQLNDEVESGKLHFVFVHGACLGAWSWYKVSTLLQTAGHNVTALDMAAEGINLRTPETVASLTDYFEPLLSFLEALPVGEKVVVVGHSLGGLGISMAMEKFPEKISVAIFVSAAMPPPLPRPFSSMEQILEMFEYVFIKDRDSGLKPFQFTEEDLETKLFPLSPSQDVTLATTLIRPQPMFNPIKSMEELRLTQAKYGSVKRAFIVSEEDKMTSKLMVWTMLILNKPDRVTEIRGSDHMVMASKPLDLAQQLSIIAQELASSTISM